MASFFRKKLSEAELQEKRRKEQEWADKCVKAGERFGERINLAGKINKLDYLVNSYPKTTVTIILMVLVSGFITNHMFVDFRKTSYDTKSISMPRDTSKTALNDEINALYYEYMTLHEKLEKKMSQVVLSPSDSMEIIRICDRMESIRDIMEQAGNYQDAGEHDGRLKELEKEIDRIEAKPHKTAEDSTRIRILLNEMNILIGGE